MMEHDIKAIAAGGTGGISESATRDSGLQENAGTENISTTSVASVYRELDETICPDLGIGLIDVTNLMMILAGFNPL